MARPVYLAVLAEVYGQVGQVDEEQCLLDEALAASAEGGQYYYAAELHRLQGELSLLQVPLDVADAASCFQRALAIAREQQAKAWGGCGDSRASARRPPTDSRRCMAGSRRGLIPSTCKRRTPCSRRGGNRPVTLMLDSRFW